jgi:restriction endonuclease S subunit
MKLSDIAQIMTGYQIRKKIIKDEASSHSLVQMSSVNHNENYIERSYVIPINSEEIAERYFLRENDIIFCLKGKYNSVVHITNQINLIASNHFAIIRADKNLCNPEYLHWLLLSKAFRKKLGAVLQGSVINSLSTHTLLNIDVEIPSMENQKHIVEVNRLAEKEILLIKRMIKLKKSLANRISE